MSVTTCSRVMRSLCTNFGAFICLCVAFVINYLLRSLKDSLDASNSQSTSTSDYILIRIVSALMSVIVVMINFILGRIIRMLSSHEKHETYTKYNVSVAIKLVIVMFINTGIIPLIVNWRRDNWFNKGGLMTDIFYNTISVSFVGPIIYLIAPAYLVRKIKICCAKSKGNKSKLTQRQANKLFEGPPLDMAQRYSNTMLLLTLSAFYVYILPIVPIIALCGTLFQYWIEK